MPGLPSVTVTPASKVTAAAPPSMRRRLLRWVLHHPQSPFQLVGMVERAGGDQAGPARGLDQGARIILARLGRRGAGDSGVAGQLLVRAEGAEGEPGDRIEPVEREHQQGGEVAPDVAAPVVDRLMLEREPPLALRIAEAEVGGHDDAAVEQAQSERPLHRRAFDQRQAGMAADAARRQAELGQEAAIGEPLPDQEGGRAAEPGRGERRQPGRARRRGERRGRFGPASRP